MQADLVLINASEQAIRILVQRNNSLALIFPFSLLHARARNRAAQVTDEDMFLVTTSHYHVLPAKGAKLSTPQAGADS